MPRQQPFCGGFLRSPRYLWIYSTICLLLYGFFKEFKPSEAFLTPYLTNETDGKNLSKHIVNDRIYPVWTYSYLGAAFFVFLFTDLMRYNPVILIESFAYLITRILLIWGNSVLAMQMMQFIYGVATATEVGYYSYIYSAVPIQYYEKLTGPVRGVVLLGRSLSSFAGQLCFSLGWLNYYGLNYVSLVSVVIATGMSLLLPWYFSWPCVAERNQDYVNIQTEPRSTSPNVIAGCDHWFSSTFKNLWHDFKRFYFQPSLLKWSLWWAFGMCGMLQVGNYVQSLWKEINSDNNNQAAVDKRYVYNGLVEGATDLLASATAIIASLLKVNWQVWGEITMGGLSLLATMLLFMESYTRKIWVAYIGHILYRSTYAFVITIASSQIAVHVDHESYGFIFGFNTLIALILQSILAAIVNTWLELDIRLQFVVYGCYYYILVLIFMFAGVYKLSYTGLIESCKNCCKSSSSSRKSFENIRESVVQYISEESTSSTDSSTDEVPTNITAHDDIDKDSSTPTIV